MSFFYLYSPSRYAAASERTTLRAGLSYIYMHIQRWVERMRKRDERHAMEIRGLVAPAYLPNRWHVLREESLSEWIGYIQREREGEKILLPLRVVCALTKLYSFSVLLLASLRIQRERKIHWERERFIAQRYVCVSIFFYFFFSGESRCHKIRGSSIVWFMGSEC